MKRLSCARFASLGLLLIACGEDQSIGPGGLDLQAIDQSISPCEDFYHYACGEWQRDHPLREDGSATRRAWDAFYATVPDLTAIIRTSMEAPESAGVDRRIGDYFISCMNAETDTSGRSAVAEELRAVYATTNVTELLQLVAKFRLLSSLSFFYIGVNPNPVLPDQYIVTFDQSGWELPDISHYLEPASADLRMEYLQHMRRLALQFNGIPLDAERALEVETALAKVALAPEQRRDPRSLHHQLRRSELDQLTPHITWQLFFDAYGLDGSGPFEVADPNYLTALDALFTNMPLATLQHHVAWQFMQDEARYLDQDILQVLFEFWGTHFTGQSELSSRDWFCFTTTNSAWSMQLAQVYSRQHPDSRGIDVVRGLVASLRQHWGAVVSDTNWLDEASRASALDKIGAMEEHARSSPRVGVFTPSQQFFLAYAQYHCENTTPELAAQRLLTDSHAPAEARVNVALANTPAFANAFGCGNGDRMVKHDSCQLW